MDQPGSFRERDEGAGWNRPRIGSMPAQQGLDANHASARDLDLRLVDQTELSLDDPAAQSSLEMPLQLGDPAGLGIVETVALAARRLGPVLREIGVAQEVLRCGAVLRKQRDADAGPRQHLASSDLKGRTQHVNQALRQRLGLVAGADPGQNDHEFITPEPGEGVGGARDRAQPCRSSLEQPVAGGVPERVVDLLEVVQVQEHDRDVRAVPPRRIERVIEPVPEQDPVGKAGQQVVVGQMLQARLGALADLDLAFEQPVHTLELGRTTQSERGRQDRNQRERGRQRDHRGRQLHQPLDPVIRVPDGPDVEEMGDAAGGDERAEHHEHPGERDLVAALGDEEDQGRRDHEVGERDQAIRTDMQPDDLGQPEIAIAVRHEIGVDPTLQCGEHGPSPDINRKRRSPFEPL